MRLIYRFMVDHKQHASAVLADELRHLEHEVHTGYDFSHMLQLVEESKRLSSRVAHARVKAKKPFSADKKTIEAAKALLTQLLHERKSLNEYIWDLKARLRVGIPTRKYRALHYYRDVLDSCIIDVQAIAA